MKILFITDIHQHYDEIKRFDFSPYDLVICGGDIIDPAHPDPSHARYIVRSLPENSIIVPGNCDRDVRLLSEMQKGLHFLHLSTVHKNYIPIYGVGYARNLIDDLHQYRAYFLEDRERVFRFYRESHLKFLLGFAGIIMNEKGTDFRVINEEEAIGDAMDFINKFAFFEEDEVEEYFNSIPENSGGILVSHSPPFGALDKLAGLPHVGSEVIRRGIERIKPGIVLCGHFHELHGTEYVGMTPVFNPGAFKDHRFGIIQMNGKFEYKSHTF